MGKGLNPATHVACLCLSEISPQRDERCQPSVRPRSIRRIVPKIGPGPSGDSLMLATMTQAMKVKGNLCIDAPNTREVGDKFDYIDQIIEQLQR